MISDNSSSLMWPTLAVFTAGLILSSLYPSFQSQIMQAGGILLALLFLTALAAEPPAGPTSPIAWLLRLALYPALIAGAGAVAYLFWPEVAGPMTIRILALVVMLLAGYAFYVLSSRGQGANTAQSNNPYDALLQPVLKPWSIFSGWLETQRAAIRSTLASQQAGTATSILQIEKTRAESATTPSWIQAVDGANRASANEGIHPEVFHSSSYQEKKLDAVVAQILKRANVELDLFKEQGEYKIRVGAVSNLATRDVDEMLRYNDDILDLTAKLARETDETRRKILTDTKDALLRAFEAKYGPKQAHQAPFGADVG